MKPKAMRIKHPNTQKGFTLVELIVSVGLGIVMIGAGVQYLSQSSRAFNIQEAASRIQENTGFSSAFLTDNIRHSGFFNPIGGNRVVAPFLRTACGGFDPCTADGANGAPDRIGIMFDPPNDIDCTGTGVAANAVIANVFFVQPDPTNNNTSTLYCQGFTITGSSAANLQANANSAAQPFVSGVANIQFQYGVTNPPDQPAITQYQSAATIGNNLQGVRGWGSVNSVRFAVLTNSGANDVGQVNLIGGAPITNTAAIGTAVQKAGDTGLGTPGAGTSAQTFFVFENPPTTIDDGNQWRLSIDTVSLINGFNNQF